MKIMEKIRFRAEQAAIVFILVLTVVYVVALSFQIPSILGGVFSGDKDAGRMFLMWVAIAAIGWGQWRYRHIVYPMHRKLKALIER